MILDIFEPVVRALQGCESRRKGSEKNNDTEQKPFKSEWTLTARCRQMMRAPTKFLGPIYLYSFCSPTCIPDIVVHIRALLDVIILPVIPRYAVQGDIPQCRDDWEKPGANWSGSLSREEFLSRGDMPMRAGDESYPLERGWRISPRLEGSTLNQRLRSSIPTYMGRDGCLRFASSPCVEQSVARWDGGSLSPTRKLEMLRT
ncbi:hypothetical protein K504DRAFT_507288 [Pleomassaria siparia CBS 279.74]|uniref:Uncharacterized protein n=1 Tax=Pleomassaria siparia CBS 279.74 TaxID=1314801 RepID=A0A6G1JUJ6_9PLEO|nr:hypothetical protein K504DRAFT_507288 [Pleomassaria siparia CBS 279.74]